MGGMAGFRTQKIKSRNHMSIIFLPGMTGIRSWQNSRNVLLRPNRQMLPLNRQKITGMGWSIFPLKPETPKKTLSEMDLFPAGSSQNLRMFVFPYHDYGRGGRGWRDLWQDCLSLLILDPKEVRSMILNSFAGVRFDGTMRQLSGISRENLLQTATILQESGWIMRIGRLLPQNCI